MINKTLLITASIFCYLGLAAQNQSIQQQIDEDVWKPFIESYANFDTDGFMAIHTEDVIRISRDGEHIRIGSEYREIQDRNNTRSKEIGATRSISFSFLERIAREEVAFEVGYYKVVSKRPLDESRTFYGHFHVVLKKVDGKWKLWVDSDTSQDHKLTEKDFQKGTVFKP